MSEAQQVTLRQDGKASFTSIYDQATPAGYLSTLEPLDYATPGQAQPLVRRCVEALRRRRQLERVTVLDLCAGYEINAALLKYRLTLGDLYARFASPSARAGGARRIAADMAWFRQRRRRDAHARVIAQDVARRALAYSQTVGLSDAVVAANLEEVDPTPEQAALMRDTDLILVTGGLSYIGARSFESVLRVARRKPWALYFPLRHTDTDAVDEAFRLQGYRVETSARAIPHRRFRTVEERQAIRARILGRPARNRPPPSRTHVEALVRFAQPLDEAPALEQLAAAPERG